MQDPPDRNRDRLDRPARVLDERRPRREDPGGGDDGDAALLRVIGVIVALGVLIAVLVLPPVSILDRAPGGDGGAGGISTQARKGLPALPEGMAARSALYDLTVPSELAGPVTMTVKLSEAPGQPRNLSLYTFDGDRWSRLGSARALDGGVAEGVVERIPKTIAVLERTSLSHGLAFEVGPGQAPDPLAGADGIVSVPAAHPALDAQGAASVLDVDRVALGAGMASGHPVYLGVTPPEDAAVIDSLFKNPALLELQARRISEAAQLEGVRGIHLDFGNLDPALREPFTSFVQQVSESLKGVQRGLVVSVPAATSGGGAATAGGAASGGGIEAGAYDWPALAAASEALWLRGPDDGDAFFERVQATLDSARAGGVELAKVWLVTDRHSRERTPEGVRRITLREALTQASEVRPRLDVGIAPGDGVTIEGVNVGGQNASGVRWNDRARAVSFAYAGRGGERTVWIENRFSLAFRLDLVRRFGLGGVVVSSAAADDALPDVWNTLSSFLEEGSVRLETPYGPYLEPNWRASEGAIEGKGSPVVWRAPKAPGVYDVTLVVSDGVVFVGQQLSLRVTEGGGRSEPTPAGTRPPGASAPPAPGSAPAGSSSSAITASTATPASTQAAGPPPAAATALPKAPGPAGN